MRVAGPSLQLFFSVVIRPKGPGDDAGEDTAETGWMELRAQPGGAVGLGLRGISAIEG